MGIRLTGLSTPVIGAEWEYIDKKNTVKETTPSLRIKSNHKIKVFISSQHGDNGKYDCVRSQLKKTIEETGLADVYMFELFVAHREEILKQAAVSFKNVRHSDD